MEIFDKKIKFNPNTIYRLIARQVGNDINGLSEPCYEVRTKVFEATVYRALGITRKDILDFIKRTYQGTDYIRFQTNKVPFTVVLFYLYHKYVLLNKPQIAETILLYVLIKFYGSSFRKAFPDFCNSDVFRYTIDNITKVHLFYREKTIANSLIFLSKVMNKKYFSILNRWEAEPLAKFIVDARSRVSQSVKSFAQNYYVNSDAGKGVKTEREPEDDDQKNMFQTTTSSTGRAAVEKFIKSMFVYKNYNQVAVNEAKKISRVKNNMAESVIPLIHRKSSEENVKIILTSFMRELLDVNALCSNEFYKLIKKLMMIRNYKDTFVFKNLVIQFTDSMFNEALSPSSKISQRDMVALYLFVAFYITISFRKLFC